jgi:hypothetical protein
MFFENFPAIVLINNLSFQFRVLVAVLETYIDELFTTDITVLVPKIFLYPSYRAG